MGWDLTVPVLRELAAAVRSRRARFALGDPRLPSASPPASDRLTRRASPARLERERSASARRWEASLGDDLPTLNAGLSLPSPLVRGSNQHPVPWPVTTACWSNEVGGIFRSRARCPDQFACTGIEPRRMFNRAVLHRYRDLPTGREVGGSEGPIRVRHGQRPASWLPAITKDQVWRRTEIGKRQDLGEESAHLQEIVEPRLILLEHCPRSPRILKAVDDAECLERPPPRTTAGVVDIAEFMVWGP